MRDDTIVVRSGDELDTAALHAWLAAVAPDLVHADTTLTVRQYPSGFSNLTYRIDLHSTAHAASSLVLRRPPHGISGGVAHDMPREHAILAALHPLGIPVPRPIACCTDPAVLGAPFYVMQHVDGLILRGAPPAALTGDISALPGRMRALSNTFVATLAALHAVDVSTAPLVSLGRPDGYTRRQVTGWTRRWEAARTHDVATMDAVARWLDAHCPADRYVSLVHNDFKFDNLVLDPDSYTVRAILDWEMATVGDPLLDLGTSLAYWVEAGDAPVFRTLGLGITALPGALSRKELADAYGEASGRDVGDVPFYLTFGLFKVAVIAQQIFARYVKGHTSDPRFGVLGQVVEELGRKAEATAAGY